MLTSFAICFLHRSNYFTFYGLFSKPITNVLSLYLQPLFLAANCLSYFCLAGNFAMMPPAIQRMFGPKNGALIYGLVYSAFGTASLATILLSKVRCILSSSDNTDHSKYFLSWFIWYAFSTLFSFQFRRAWLQTLGGTEFLRYWLPLPSWPLSWQACCLLWQPYLLQQFKFFSVSQFPFFYTGRIQ